MMDLNKCLDGARKMAANAKDGTLKIDGQTYTFKFDAAAWNYQVLNPDGSELHIYNTKSLKQARQWLREYFAN